MKNIILAAIVTIAFLPSSRANTVVASQLITHTKQITDIQLMLPRINMGQDEFYTNWYSLYDTEFQDPSILSRLKGPNNTTLGVQKAFYSYGIYDMDLSGFVPDSVNFFRPTV